MIDEGVVPLEGLAAYSPGADVIALVYFIAACAMCAYGLHRLWLTWWLLRDGQRARQVLVPAQRFTELPRVTVQLPMFNERHVAERIIEAVCALDYPRERLEIQVLDDSNDDSVSLVRACCERLASAGHPISHLHRTGREGFKSGALAAGLKTATGELIVIFDADFIPDPNFLLQTIHHFTDPSVGVVQAEWSHLNRSTSWLTELQAIFLDGHFVVEQAVRSLSGRWFNFNGTAGVWRRRCIEDAGGWEHDTLTEDNDLSYRAQLRGWRFLYLPTVRCRAELPSTMTAFLGQQHRWTKGLIQTARKLLPRILVSGASWRIKAEAWFHLTSPFLYLLMFLLSAIALPAMFVATPFTDRPIIALVGLAAFFVGALGAATFYVVSQRVQGLPILLTLLRIPLLMALGVGICVVNARAVVEALLGLRSPFVRTPKVGGDAREPEPETASLPGGVLELLMSGVLAECFLLTFQRPFTLIGAPFLLLCALGYSGVGALRLLEPLGPRVPRLRRSATRLAASALGVTALAAGALGTMRLAQLSVPPTPPPMRIAEAPRHLQSVLLDVNLTAANWQPLETIRNGITSASAIRSVHPDGGSWDLQIALDETTTEGALALDLNAAAQGLGLASEGLFLGPWYRMTPDVPDRQLVFEIEVPPRFIGELQAFARDGQGRSEYGAMSVFLGSDNTGLASVTLTPGTRTPAMGHRDEGFDPVTGITEVGLKLSAQSDRVRGAAYRPFSGTIRMVRAGIADVRAEPAPELRPPEGEVRALRIVSRAEFLSGSGVDRPWPQGYAFAGPVTPAITAELERTDALIAAQGSRFTRVYVGDYRAGLVFDATGKVSGVEPQFLDYLDELAKIANRHGLTVMLSLTDNAMLNGGNQDRIGLVREGEASDAFIANGLVEVITKLRGRDVIWDLFNEPENVTAVPLRELQRYVDRALAAGRRADPRARFTVVSRSRPELCYWRGRGLSLYSHNIFTERSLAESLAEPRALEAPILVAEMAPELVSGRNMEALRQAGYGGLGIWGWGTLDKYQCSEEDLLRLTHGEASAGVPCDN